jgi:hypothetical protein
MAEPRVDVLYVRLEYEHFMGPITRVWAESSHRRLLYLQPPPVPS